jgi:hypothetical protein
MISDAAAWVHGGTRARQDYNERRVKEVKLRPAFGGVPCFHNGVSPLGAVDAFHSKIRKSLPSYDREITESILSLVENSMLLSDVNKREVPRGICSHLVKILESASLGFETSSRDDEIAKPAPERPKPRQEMSRDAAVKYYNDCKKHGSIPDPEVQKTVNTLRANLGDRDFIFLIDTSGSMKQYEERMRITLLIYAYIAKNIDQDGRLEVYFNSQTKLKQYRTSRAVIRDLAHQEWNSLGFERIFSDFIDHLLHRLRKPEPWPPKKQSVFVFTDGRWSGLDNVKHHIRRVIRAIADQDLGRTQVSIQFVSFGTDPKNIGQLQELDNFGRKEVLGM